MTLLTSVLALSLAAGTPAAAPSPPAARPTVAVAAPQQETGRPWVAVLALAVLGGAALFLHRRKQQQPQTGRLELVERLSLGPRRALLRVRFGESELLLASTEGGVQCLTTTPASGPTLAPPTPASEAAPRSPLAETPVASADAPPPAPVSTPPPSQTESLLTTLFEQAAKQPAAPPAPKPFEMAPPAEAPRISLGQPPVSLPMAPLQRVVVRGVPSFEAALHEAASTEDAELRSKLSRAGRRSAR